MYAVWAIFELCRTRSCWRRVWIIQEIALARKVTLFWGVESLDWAILEECVLLLGEYSFSVRQVAQYGLSDEDLALLEVSFKGIKLELVPLVSSRFCEQHHHEGSDQIHDLPDLLKIFQSGRATDIRDKNLCITWCGLYNSWAESRLREVVEGTLC